MAAPTTWTAPPGGSSVNGAYLSFVGGRFFCTYYDTVWWATDPTQSWSIWYPTGWLPSGYRVQGLSPVDYDGTYYAYAAGWVKNEASPSEGSVSIFYTTDPDDGWSEYVVDSAAEHDFESFNFSNGLWVLSGSDLLASTSSKDVHRISYSSAPNGTWTVLTNPLSFGATYDNNAVVYKHNGEHWMLKHYRSGAEGQNYYATALDGTWTQISTSQSGTSVRWSGITSENLGGGDALIPMLNTSSRTTMGITTDFTTGDYSIVDTSILPGTGGWDVANAAATDGSMWLVVGQAASGGSFNRKAAYNNSTTLATGSGTWTTTSPFSGVGAISSVTYGYGVWVVVDRSLGLKHSGTYTPPTPATGPTLLRQRQSPLRTPARVRGVDLRQRQTPFIT